jgi:hypothetical protein
MVLDAIKISPLNNTNKRNINVLNPFQYLDITENKIIAKYKCYISIDFKDFDNEEVVNSGNHLFIPGMLEVFIPELDDFCPININYQIYLNKTEQTQEADSFIIINYNVGDVILTGDYVKTTFNIAFLLKLLHGSIKYIKDPHILLQVLHNTFPESDLVHMELIISNMVRDSLDPNILARYKTGNKNNQILGVEKQASLDSPLSAMAFKNIDRAIANALITGKEVKNNPIEKVLREDFS